MPGGKEEEERTTKETMDEIHEVTGMKLRDVMTERKQWRSLAMMVARVPGTDSTK